MKDCIIVGGGLIGMLSARELTLRGLDVLLLEKGELGQESSWAGGGIISPLHPWHYSERIRRLANIGHHVYPGLAEQLKAESGVDPEYIRSGMMVLESDEQQAATDWANHWSMPIQLIDTSQQLQALIPGIDPGFDQGIWLPDIGQMRNPRLVKALKGSLQALSIDYLEHIAVEEISVDNGQIKGVVANGKSYHADKVLIAGGAWSASLLSGYQAPKIEPVKGQMIIFKAEPDVLNSMVLRQSRYLIPRKDGRILCGSTIEHAGFDKSTSPDIKQELVNSAAEIIPALADYEVEHHWAGLRPGSPQGEPFIGPHADIRGLYVNAGHYRNGVVLGIGSCREIAEIILSANH